MHVAPVLADLRAALAQQRSLAGDASTDDAIDSVIEALTPALRLAALELAQQAAVEVAAQLDDATVDVVVAEGEPTLRVRRDVTAAASTTTAEDFDARITLRLPPTLKNMVEDAASTTGDSVNAWVVDALTQRARTRSRTGGHVTEGFDL